MAYVQPSLSDTDELELDLEEPSGHRSQQEGFEGTDVQLTSLYSHDLHSSDEHDPLHTTQTQPTMTQLEGGGMQPARSPRSLSQNLRSMGDTHEEHDTLETSRSGQKAPDRTGLVHMRCKLAIVLALLLVLWIPVIYVWTRKSSGSAAGTGSVLVTGVPNPRESTPPNTLIAYIGDVGLESTTAALYDLIAREGAQAIVIQGDLDYADSPSRFSDMLDQHFNDSVAVYPVAGNHDVQSTAWPGYSAAIVERWQRAGVDGSCAGLAGEAHTCSFKGILLVQVAPGIWDSRDSDPGAAATAYLRSEFTRYAGTTRWFVGSWHKNQREMQTGRKASETGWGVYEACREAGALIATGHEHSYARTFLLSSFSEQILANLSWNATASFLPLSPGNSLAFCNGLGGRSVRGNERCGLETSCPWFANLQNSHADGSTGVAVQAAALFCNYNHEGQPNRTRCYLKATNSEQVLDEFIMDATHMPITTG